ncbi:MAG: Cell division protein MraZ [Hydrogenibacillus schlegelii]|uniref:Transcriptional regulator MraZ n=1 Tax=Hydrogenibacillus schlegelii TaxID=1484 RepID=A0A2T5GF21_HYDSH|nr:MAG: Cell division protein MraZ [Hydrogenibacillus schlegelii]
MGKSGGTDVFLGEYRHALDEKGRLTLPARLREGLGERFVLTRGLEQALFVYPLEEWEKIAQKLRALPFTRADARAFTRFFFSGAVELSPDRQGRITIPKPLLEYAGIEKNCVILGVMNRVEIWEEGRWDRYAAEQSALVAETAERLLDFEG